MHRSTDALLFALLAILGIITQALAQTMPACLEQCDNRCQELLATSIKTDLTLRNLNSDRFYFQGQTGIYRYEVSIYYKQGTTTIAALAPSEGPYVLVFNWGPAGIHRYIINTKYDSSCTLKYPQGATITSVTGYYVPNFKL